MAEEKLYYIDSKGEYKEDKRSSGQKIEYTLAKINLTIGTMEKAVEARLTMFESLLRERLENSCADIDDLVEENKTIEGRISKMFNEGSQRLLERQEETDKRQNEKLAYLSKKVTDHEARIELLEDKPTLSKAKVFDKVVVALGSLIAGYIAANLKDIFNFFAQ